MGEDHEVGTAIAVHVGQGEGEEPVEAGGPRQARGPDPGCREAAAGGERHAGDAMVLAVDDEIALPSPSTSPNSTAVLIRRRRHLQPHPALCQTSGAAAEGSVMASGMPESATRSTSSRSQGR
jgi:hypothetical protein